MAARVNMKIVWILGIALVVAIGSLAGIWFLQTRNDATRHVKRGDEHVQEGELRLASRSYRRALGRDPGNRVYLKLYEDTVSSIRPDTADEAAELYSERLMLLSHAVRHFPNDADAHLRLLHELHYGSRFTNRLESWQQLAQAGDEMFSRVPTSDPRRVHARLYRGMAQMHASSAVEWDDLEAAEEDLTVFVDAVPESDLGWASLIQGQMAIAEKLRAERTERAFGEDAGMLIDADEKYAQVDRTIVMALEHVPDGPELAKAMVIRAAIKHTRDEEAVSDEELTAIVQRMDDLAKTADDPMYVAEVGNVLRTFRPPVYDGRQASIDLLETFLQRQPDRYLHRLQLANDQMLTDQLDDAELSARAVIDAEPLTVSLLARVQDSLRRRASTILVDLEYRRWESAGPEEKAESLAKMESALEEMRGLVVNAETDPLLRRSEGKVYFARGDYAAAAPCFEFLIEREMADLETYIFSAQCLSRIGQIGLAQERLSRASDLRPENPRILMDKARLEYNMRQYELALATIEQVLELDPDYEAAIQLRDAANRQITGEDVLAEDPVFLGVQAAQASFERGDVTAARERLLALLGTEGESLPLLLALTRLEINVNETAQAQQYLDRARAVSPNHEQIPILQATLDTDDPIERLEQVVRGMSPDDSQFVVSMVVNLRSLVAQQEALATDLAQNGDEAAAAEARALAARAREQVQTFLERAQAVAADHPGLIETEFEQAMRAEDWAAAERVIARAREFNSDQANGLLYQGRYFIIRQDYDAAIRTLEEASTIKGYSSDVWSALGFAYQFSGNMYEAERAYEQAYARNPTDSRTGRQYARLLLQKGKQSEALLVLQNLRRLAAEDRDLHNFWLTLESQVGDLSMALTMRRELYASDPSDRNNAVQLAGLLGRTTPTYDMLVDEQGNPLFNPRAWQRMTAAERQVEIDKVRREWVADADEILDRLDAKQGRTLELARLRADLLAARGLVDEGEEVIESFIADQLPDVTAKMYVTLAEFQSSRGLYAEAWQTLQVARQHQKEDSREADIALANLLFTQGKFDLSLEAYNRVLEINQDRVHRLRAVECLVKLGEYDDAGEQLTAIGSETEGDYITTMLWATIRDGQAVQLAEAGLVQRAEERRADYRAALERAKSLSPSASTPHVLEAQGKLNQYLRSVDTNPRPALLDDALVVLDRAESIMAQDPQIALTRARIMLIMDDQAGAVSQLNKILERNPAHVSAREELIRLYLQQDRPRLAVAQVEAAIEFNPEIPKWQELKGELYYLRLRDPASAIEAYRKAYEIAPSTPRLMKLCDASLAVPEPDFQDVANLLDRREAALAAEPLLRCLYAKALTGLERRDDALEQLRLAFPNIRRLVKEGRRPSRDVTVWYSYLNPLFAGNRVAEGEAFVLEVSSGELDAIDLWSLGRLWRTAGTEGISRVIELNERAIEICPADNVRLLADINSDLGTYRYVAEDYVGAGEAFARVVELQPENAEMLNNYAYLLTDSLDNPSKALEFAERAAALDSESGSYHDTLGWTHFKLGHVDQARSLLQRAIDLEPTADKHLHMAYVLSELGEWDAALRELDAASELEPDPETQAEITRLADDIRTRRH